MNGRGEVAPFVRPGGLAETFAAQVRIAQDELAEAVEKAGLRRDPYSVLIGAISNALGLLPALIDQMEQRVKPESGEQAALTRMAELHRDVVAINAEAGRLTHQQVTEALKATTPEFARGLRREVRNELAAHAVAIRWGVAAAVGAVVVAASALTGLAVHYADAAGQGRAVVEVRDALGGVFRDTSASGRAAAALIEANAGVMDAEMARCQGGDVWTDPSGRRVCRLVVYLDPARSVPGERR